MEEAAPPPSWTPDEPAIAAGRLRVLVADSAGTDRFSLGAILRRIEPTIEILEAPNGAVAERLLRERNVDIGFIDRRLPGFDGREVQNWASTSDNRSMFVLVSDRLVPKWSEIATLINAYEVMLKPFNESHVENLLKVFWRLNRSADVLIVDRSRTARKIIRDMLERTRFNFRVDETDTGANALRAVKASAFDIVLVDAGVDGGMGAEAACRVARDAPGSKVVLIGGADMRTSRSALTQFDLSGFILKPFDGAVLESALHDVLKPNQDISDPGYDTWGESLGDQIAMWASLRNPERVRGVIAETSGDLYKSNSLTRMGEFSASLTGRGTGVRDAFHNKKVSDTTEEVHDRSEVLTGAAYKVFTLIYNGLKNGQGNEHAALTEAADIMGVFLTHTADFTPENRLTLEDLGKAYLKVDKELFGGRYHTMFADEFINREIFNTGSVGEWMAHEAAVPQLRLPKRASIHKLERLVQGNLDLLGIGPDFGLKLQSVTRDARFGKTIVRVQLTDGRSSDAALLDNHGILTFRADGTLADYHTPLPSEGTSPIQTQSHVRALAFVNQAKQLGLDRRGGLLSIVRRPDGQLTVESRVMRSEDIYCWIEAFTFEHPEGERREVIVPTIPGNLSGIQPNGVQILTASDLNK